MTMAFQSVAPTPAVPSSAFWTTANRLVLPAGFVDQARREPDTPHVETRGQRVRHARELAVGGRAAVVAHRIESQRAVCDQDANIEARRVGVDRVEVSGVVVPYRQRCSAMIR